MQEMFLVNIKKEIFPDLCSIGNYLETESKDEGIIAVLLKINKTALMITATNKKIMAKAIRRIIMGEVGIIDTIHELEEEKMISVTENLNDLFRGK